MNNTSVDKQLVVAVIGVPLCESKGSPLAASLPGPLKCNIRIYTAGIESAQSSVADVHYVANLITMNAYIHIIGLIKCTR